jgi:hypothetical protein
MTPGEIEGPIVPEADFPQPISSRPTIKITPGPRQKARIMHRKKAGETQK